MALQALPGHVATEAPTAFGTLQALPGHVATEAPTAFGTLQNMLLVQQVLGMLVGSCYRMMPCCTLVCT